MVRITSDVNWTPGRANKVLGLGAGVQISYVHSSIIMQVKGETIRLCLFLLSCICMYTQYSDSVNFQVMTITQRDQH